jgi:hypothetical protein
MSFALGVLEELAGIGAKIEPAGAQLILRAGPAAIPAALVRRVRAAKSDLIEILRPSGAPDQAATRERHIVAWLDQHPSPSRAGRCAWCGDHESPDAIVLPFGTEPGTHTWLHAKCWRAWHAQRRTTALDAVSDKTGSP